MEHKKYIVDKGQAVIEFESWLKDRRRLDINEIFEDEPDSKESFDKCIMNISRGYFSIDNETGDITHKLKFPIGEEYGEGLSELVYKPRLQANWGDVLRKIKNPDDLTKTRSAISCLSGKTLAYISKMENSDLLKAGDLLLFYFLQ